MNFLFTRLADPTKEVDEACILYALILKGATHTLSLSTLITIKRVYKALYTYICHPFNIVNPQPNSIADSSFN